jgi:hypothetical protein
MRITNVSSFAFDQITKDSPVIESLSLVQAATVTGGAAAPPASSSSGTDPALIIVGGFIQAGVAIATGINIGWPYQSFSSQLNDAYKNAAKLLGG